MPKIIYEFDMHEDSERLRIFRDAEKTHGVLFDMYNFISNEMKYKNHREDIYDILESLSGILSELDF